MATRTAKLKQGKGIGVLVAGAAVAAIGIAAGSKKPPVDQVLVPPVIGLTEAQATSAIIAQGLAVGNIVDVNSSAPVGEVISQDPPADTPVAPGFSVNLTVSLGPGSGVADVTLNPAVTYQTMSGGLEATDQYGEFDQQDNYRTLPLAWQTELMGRLVNEMGCRRSRLEVRMLFFNTSPGVFDFTELALKVDITMAHRAAALANGYNFYWNVSFIGIASDNDPWNRTPSVYADTVLRAFQFIVSRTGGVVPDSFELANEPGNFKNSFAVNGNPDGVLISQCAIAAGDLLAANGYFPEIIGPSCANISLSLSTLNEMLTVPGILQYLTTACYHRYGSFNVSNLQTFRNLAQANGLKTMMGEFIGISLNQFFEDFLVGEVSAWQKYAAAWYINQPATENYDGIYYGISNPDTNPSLTWGTTNRLLAQVFRYLLDGAVVIDAQSTNLALTPIAWVNPSGLYVVVVRTSSAQTFSIGGLPAGTYGIDYVTNGNPVFLADQTIAAGQDLTTTIPGTGMISIYEL